MLKKEDMKIYFGKTDDTDGTFESNGKRFYYELEMQEGEDSFVIKDSCNRFVPMELADVVPLINALSYIRDYSRTKKLAEDYVFGTLNKLSRAYGLEAKEF